MTKSKCTCKHRIRVHVRDQNYPHEPDCYYAEKIKQENDARAENEAIEKLYKHYKRVQKQEGRS